jgi:predicted methyltransferase
MMMRLKWITNGVAITAACLLGLGGCATPGTGEAESEDEQAPVSEAEDDSADESASEADSELAHGDHQEKRFTDPEKRAESWNDPARDHWQQPEAIIDAMDIEEGMSVADIGAGTGYFLPFLSEAVGEDGRVLAVDLEEAMLEYIEEQAQEKGLDNVETVRAQKTESGLEEASVDRILLVNTWHHIPSRGEYARHLGERLTDGGELWIVDYRLDSPSGPPEAHRLEPAEVVAELEAGGFEAELHELGLERQFVVVGRSE